MPDFATNPDVGQHSAISDLVKKVVRMLDLEEHVPLIRSRFTVPYSRQRADPPSQQSHSRRKWACITR
ncbi:hypothetical protein WG66_014152 [Moniliophthora roreri]|uniref:Uncharacterized protein n=1 Tax=Moniliophthora roreri TaxID=221103 RepID=A0A0W0ETW8_MONRR|nr:hypothetical protein WG66_014152 [Moniliophthora roreri]